MSKIKFILEVDEQYVHDCADPAKAAENAANGGEGKNEFLTNFVNFFGFASVEKKVDAGTKEFVINRDNLDEKAHEVFDHVLGNIAVLSGIAKKGEEEEKKEEEKELRHALIRA